MSDEINEEDRPSGVDQYDTGEIQMMAARTAARDSTLQRLTSYIGELRHEVKGLRKDLRNELRTKMLRLWIVGGIAILALLLAGSSFFYTNRSAIESSCDAINEIRDALITLVISGADERALDTGASSEIQEARQNRINRIVDVLSETGC